MAYQNRDINHQKSSWPVILITGGALAYTIYLGATASKLYFILSALLLIPFAIAIGPALANKLGGQVSRSLYLGTAADEKLPLMSKARAKELHHEYDEAVDLYMQIIEEFPTEVMAYASLFEILGNKQKNMRKLTEVHEKAILFIKDPKQLNNINRLYYEYKK